MFDGEEENSVAPEPGVDPPSFVRSALVFYGAMGCIALLWRMAEPGQSILHPTPEAAANAWGVVGALAIGVVVGLASIAISEALTEWTSLGDGLADLLGESLAGLRVSDAVLLALASGLGEEMFFRGALQPAVGLFWASVIFGACHFLPRKELVLWSGYAVVMGIAFGALYNWTGHLLAPVTAHVVVNGVNLPRLARRYEENQAAVRARNLEEADTTSEDDSPQG